MLGSLLYRMKVKLELERHLTALRGEVATLSKRAPAAADELAKVAIRAKRALRFQENTSSDALTDASLGDAASPPGSLAAAAKRTEALASALRACPPADGPEGGAEVYRRARDFALELLRCDAGQGACDSDAAVAVAAATPSRVVWRACVSLARAVGSAGLAHEVPVLKAAESGLARLHKEHTAVRSVATDAAAADRAATQCLEAKGAAELRRLLQRVSDERIHACALQELREQTQREAQARLQLLEPELSLADAHCAARRAAVALWKAVKPSLPLGAALLQLRTPGLAAASPADVQTPTKDAAHLPQETPGFDRLLSELSSRMKPFSSPKKLRSGFTY